MTFLHKNVGPQKRIFTAPKKQEQDAQQLQEKQKQLQKVLKLTSQGKSRKQVKSELHQEVSEFNPSGQMCIEQLIQVKLNLLKKVRKLRMKNSKMSEQIQHGFLDTLVLEMTNQEREHFTLWQYQQEQYSQTNSQMQKIYDQNEQIENYSQRQKSLHSQQIVLEQNRNTDKMEIVTTLQHYRQLKEITTIKKMCQYCQSQWHRWKN